MRLSEWRPAVRSLGRSPGFAIAVIGTLALGIGANTAVYSVVEAVLLRPLPYPEPDRLVFLAGDHRPGPMGEEISTANFLDWRRESRSFDGLGAFAPAMLNLSHDAVPERLRAAQVTPGALAAIGAAPLLGRLFLPDEERADSRVAILSYGLWKSRFGGDPDVTSRTVRLTGIEYPIVGVMPEEFRFPDERVQVWVPFRMTPDRMADRGSRWIYAVGRLKKDVSLGVAQREMDGLARALARRFPRENGGWGVRISRLQDHLVGSVRPALWILLATSLLVLVTACANVANLALARAASRRSEMAVRAALGGSASDLARPLLIEATVLTAGGAALGVVLAVTVRRGLGALAAAGLPRMGEVRLDAGVLAFTLFLSVATVIGFGTAPALAARRTALVSGLRRGGRGSSRGSLRGRRAVTLAQLASATVLLVGAGLLLASLASLARVAPGFSPDRIVTMEIVLPGSRYDVAGRSAFFREVVARAARLPGVETAAGTSHLPLEGSNSTESYAIEGRPPADPNEVPEAPVRSVTPGYFAALSIPISAGRDFTARDSAASPPVVVVNRAFARLFGPGTEALGRRILLEDLSGRRVAWEIVGIAGDVRAASLGQAAVGEIYVSSEQRPYDALTLTLRTSVAPAAIAAAVRAEVARLDADQPVSEPRTMRSFVEGSIARPRLTTALLAVFAGLALLIAGVGLFSLIAYSVGERRREIGVRVALGARPFDVVRLVVGEAAVLAAAGLAAGLAIAAATTRALSSLLYGIGPRDPRIFAASAAVLAAISLAASLAPAARAARIPPSEALRAD